MKPFGNPEVEQGQLTLLIPHIPELSPSLLPPLGRTGKGSGCSMEKPEVQALIAELSSKSPLKAPRAGDAPSAEGAEHGWGTAPAGSPGSQFRLLLHCTNKNLLCC